MVAQQLRLSPRRFYGAAVWMRLFFFIVCGLLRRWRRGQESSDYRNFGHWLEPNAARIQDPRNILCECLNRKEILSQDLIITLIHSFLFSSPGEICPLAPAEGNASFVLPSKFQWAPATAPCASSPPERPSCCSGDAQSFCQFIHDQTPQGICPYGRPICCQRPQNGTQFEITSKGICSTASVQGTSIPGLPGSISASSPVAPQRFKKSWIFPEWKNDQSRKPVSVKLN